jgi:hypothetical protein
MTHHRIIGTLVVVLTIIAFGGSPYAARQAQEATVTGCLQAATNAGDFVLVTDEKETYQLQAAEGVDLASHANHRVELTGIIEKTDASAVLKASALKMIANSCEA